MNNNNKSNIAPYRPQPQDSSCEYLCKKSESRRSCFLNSAEKIFDEIFGEHFFNAVFFYRLYICFWFNFSSWI